MPGGAAHRDDRLQDAAGALGEGTDPDRQEDSAARDEERNAVAYEAGGLYHLTANISYPLMIVLYVLLMPAMIIRCWQGWLQMLLIDLPLFMASHYVGVDVLSGQLRRNCFPSRW